MSRGNSFLPPNPPYVTEDLAVLIPTKDRPGEVCRLLRSIAELDCKVGRVIVIASGQDIRDAVMDFQQALPVEYHSSQPGQIRQRNLGISLLDDSTKLVASLDDDAQLHRSAVSEMIRFWNNVSVETAGVGFNIVNLPRPVFRWHDVFFGLSREPGRVMKSGQATPIINVEKSIRSEWLNGGATVWRQEILKTYHHREVRSRWAVFEDAIFSYPIGRRYPLYICADAKIEIEDIAMRNESRKLIFYRGKAQFLWGLYFVLSTPQLSLRHFMFYQFLQSFHSIVVGILRLNPFNFFMVTGIWTGFFLSVMGAIKRQSIIELIEEYT